MSKRKSSTKSTRNEIRKFTGLEIDRGIAILQRRIRDVKDFDQKQIRYDDAKKRTVESSIRNSIREVFGQQSPEFHEHEYHEIWLGGLNYLDPPQKRQQKFVSGIPQSITMLEGLIERLEEKREDLNLDEGSSTSNIAPISSSRKVFIVHGHDEAAKLAVARFLESIELEPIILHEQPSQGRTLIEKFEENADVEFAIVLLTPDDVGHPEGRPDQGTPRARQNVIFELGFFFGKLGRDRVCALLKNEIEILSDISGVIYVHMDDSEGWKLKLAKEIKAAGIDVNLENML